MLEDLDETIRQLLIAELPVRNGEIEISFDQPKREWSTRRSKPALNLFLYDVRENNILRQHQWEQLPVSGNGKAHLKRLPFRVDCTYMITTWASVPEDEHRLLTRCLLALFRFPILPNDRLVGSLRNPPFEIQAQLGRHDKLTNPAEVWSSLDNEIRPSVSYVVTLALDPWSKDEGIQTSPIVLTRTLRTGQATDLPRLTEIADNTLTERADHTLDELSLLEGKVIDASRSGLPLPNIEVAIKGTGLFTKTDAKGRFLLGSVPPNTYTLIAWLPNGKPKEKRIIIPREKGEANYDIEI